MAEGANLEEKGLGCDVCCLNYADPENLVGMQKYDYKYMCTPKIMALCKKATVPAPFFFGKDEKLPLLLSLFLGFQHCIAMVGGIATSGGYLIANDACLPWQKDTDMCAKKSWLISCAWLASGTLSIIQIFRAHIKGTPYFLGTGLISMMGTSFTFLPIARTMVVEAIVAAKATSCALDGNGDPIFTGTCAHAGDSKGAGAIGYGKFLGTCMVASLAEILISFIPPKIMRKLCPPVVAGSAVMLIGGGLISAGVKYVGGGVFCGENTESRIPPTITGAVSPIFINGVRTAPGGTPQLCFGDNGDVVLSFGSSAYVGLGMSVVFCSIFIQIFGSPFLKSTFLFWSLCFGCILASAGHEGNSYFRKDYWEAANDNPVSFFWSKGTFPIGFQGEYFLPILIGFIISTAESIGDVAMTCKFSGVTDEDEQSSRIQGGLLADGVNSFIATCFGSPPNTTFSQNCGLIPLTRCASRAAGFAACFWLILLGVFSHFGAAFASIPICVVGGLVLQAFTAVFVAGMSLATTDFTRRNQFILMIALGVGLGVAMEGHIVDWPGPYTFFRRNLAYDYGFWPEKHVCKTPNALFMHADGKCHDAGLSFGINNGNCCSEYDTGKKALRTTVLLICKTPYAIGFIFAFVLNLIIPEDTMDAAEEAAGAGKTTSVASA